jgi:DNA-binding transcriptional LysR family regulator
MPENALSLSGLSIERLRSFCQIVDAGSVVAAAGRNPTKQSQFSRQIRDLERVLGVKLFVREGKRLKLTADGVKLSALTNAYFNALREISGVNHGAPPPLKLGAAESVIRWLLIPRFTEVISTAGGPVEMENHRTSEVVSRLENGQLDLGIIRADARSDALELLPFPILRYVLMVPRAALPEKSAAGILSVRVLPFVSITGAGQFVRAVDKIIEANRLPLKILSKVESFSLAIEVAKVLGAATFVPSQAESEFPTDQFTPVALDGMDALNRKLVVAFSKKTTELNTRAKRFAVRLSRAYESASLPHPDVDRVRWTANRGK